MISTRMNDFSSSNKSVYQIFFYENQLGFSHLYLACGIVRLSVQILALSAWSLSISGYTSTLFPFTSKVNLYQDLKRFQVQKLFLT